VKHPIRQAGSVPDFENNPMNEIKEQIKTMLVENLMLQVPAAQIADDQPLFGPGSLGLDSVDALQMVVALDKNFGLKIADPNAAKQILHSVNTIARAVEEKVAA
jgi:acyl carrier protein